MYKTGPHKGTPAEITASLRNFLIYLLIYFNRLHTDEKNIMKALTVVNILK